MKDENDSQYKNLSPPNLWKLLRIAGIPQWRVATAAAYSVINKLFDVTPEILIGIAVDTVVVKQESFLARLGVVDPFQQLALLGALTFGSWAFESIFEYLYFIAWKRIAQDLQHSLRLQALRSIHSTDLLDVEGNRTLGDLVAVVNDDVNQLERFFDTGWASIIRLITSTLAIGAIFVAISPTVAAFALVPTPIVIAGSILLKQKIEPWYARIREAAGALSSLLTNQILALRTIRSFGEEQGELKRAEAASANYRDLNRRAILYTSAFTPTIRVAILSGFLGTLIYGGRLTLTGELSPGSYGILIFLTQRMLWPLTEIAMLIDGYQRAKASVRRLAPWLSKLTPQIASDLGGSAQILGDVRFENVVFAYPGREPVLKGVHLHIRTGEGVALLGPTGSGKSTLAQILLGLFRPSSGKVWLGSRSIEEISLSDLRRLIGYVSQEVHLLGGTIRQNIAFGAPDATDEQIRAAAQAAQAEEFILKLPKGYDTLVGDRGQQLSGGQRQRLALARALVRNPQILVFDEPTSALDRETEEKLLTAMEVARKGRTLLLITHREEWARRLNRVVRLENGKIL
jgi:ATP-binding cassette subfamily B protein